MTHFDCALAKGYIQRHAHPQPLPKILKAFRVTVGAAVNVVVLEAVQVAAEEKGPGCMGVFKLKDSLMSCRSIKAGFHVTI
jgi:hypothetical protein